MLAKLAQTIGDLPEPYIIGVILLPVLFVGWVIISERRTRHLTQLIRAVRRPVHSADDSRARHRGSR